MIGLRIYNEKWNLEIKDEMWEFESTEEMEKVLKVLVGFKGLHGKKQFH